MNGCFTTGDLFIPNGNVGIGTSSLTTNTEVEISSSDARTTLTLDNRSAFVDGCTRTSISFESINDTDARSQYAAINAITTAGTYGGGELSFFTRRPGDGSNAESMRIDDAGQVGIGTDAPFDGLHVHSGYVRVTGNPGASALSGNGIGKIGGLTGNGLYAYGKGSTYDLALANANTTVALAIPTAGSATPVVYIPNSPGS